jgi:competence protein ComEA
MRALAAGRGRIAAGVLLLCTSIPVLPAAWEAVVPSPRQVGAGGLHAIDPIDVNRSGAEELSLLPGIGPVAAQAIVADRALHGAYRNAGELDRVRGIGPATVARFRPYVSVLPPDSRDPSPVAVASAYAPR